MPEAIAEALGVGGAVGAALMVFAFLFRDIIRKSIFPKLTPRQGLFLMTLLVICITGVTVLVIILGNPIREPSGPTHAATVDFDPVKDVRAASLYVSGSLGSDSGPEGYSSTIKILRNPVTTIDGSAEQIGHGVVRFSSKTCKSGGFPGVEFVDIYGSASLQDNLTIAVPHDLFDHDSGDFAAISDVTWLLSPISPYSRELQIAIDEFNGSSNFCELSVSRTLIVRERLKNLCISA